MQMTLEIPEALNRNDQDIENIIANIDFSMKMEDMPLTKADKDRLRSCLNGKTSIAEILRLAIKKHTWAEA